MKIGRISGLVFAVELVAFSTVGILALGVNLVATRTVFTLPQVIGSLLVGNAIIYLLIGFFAVTADDKKTTTK